jgi:basic membrane protein A
MRALLAAVGIAAVATSASSCSRAPVTESKSEARALRVAVIFAIGSRKDDGFNRGAAEGAQRAVRDGGIDLRLVDAVPEREREATIERLADSSDLVVGVGFLLSDPLTRAAARHPSVRFASLDYAIPVDAAGRAILPSANLAAVVFREEEGAYLVGAAAGLATRTRAVGFVGGMSSPMIRRFEAGYEAGVRRTCGSCRFMSSFAGATAAAFSDPARGRALAAAQYDAGADVVFHAAGQTGDGVFAASREGGGRRLVIGVDVDQQALAPGRTLTSMLKRMDVAVLDVIRRARAGTLKGGLQAYGLAEEGVGYVRDERNAALVDAATARQLDILRAGIVAGLIVVPTSR